MLGLCTHKSNSSSVLLETYAEHIKNQIDSTNYHFQVQAYVQIAKVCALTLIFLLSFTVLAILLPQAIVAVSSPFNVMGEMLCVMAGGVTGFSGYTLFGTASKISPSAEDIIFYQPFG